MSTSARPESPVVSGPSEVAAVYRDNVGAISSFFARRCSESQAVADLTSETFVGAITSFSSFDPRRGSVRAWLFGIARRVYADHCAAAANAAHANGRLAAQMILDEDEIEQLAARIDGQAEGRRLLARCARLPELDRAAIELVDLSGLSYKEAGSILQVSPGALRVRLFRARARLRKGAAGHD
jgi:RNA polymerase sigma factor (sigma-70 family)